MNEKEKKIIELIRWDPFITQQDLADRLNVSRSAVAGYISALTRQGIIKGRAYVMNEGPGIMVMGGANIDRKITLIQGVTMGDSNPASTANARGGVARNIAENLVNMGLTPLLFTVLGQDQDGEHLRNHAVERGIDLSLTLTQSGQSTGSYSAILDEKHDLILAAADMAIYDTVTPEDVERAFRKAGKCDWIIADTNFSLESLQEALKQAASMGGTKFAVIPVSAQKLNRIPKQPEQIDLLILNHLEAKTLVKNWTGFDHDHSSELVSRLMHEGVSKVIVTEGAEGVTFSGEEGQVQHVPAPATTVVDVTGAGDAFSAGVLYSLSEGKPLSEAVEIGLNTAKLTLESTDTVTNMITEAWLQKISK